MFAEIHTHLIIVYHVFISFEHVEPQLSQGWPVWLLVKIYF